MFRSLTILALALSLPSFAQSTSRPAAAEPRSPRDFFAIAAPTYDFGDPTLKPWHLKATYQIYDQDSNPKEQGTYEHWWASSNLYRDSWKRSGLVHSVWHTEDGKFAYEGSGSLDYFEYALQSALLSPLPGNAELDPTKVRLEREDVKMAGVKFPCIKVIPHMPAHSRVQVVPLGLFPTYCFDNKLPVLRLEFSWGSLTMEFNSIIKVQGRYLPREVLVYEGKRKLLTAKVETVEGLAPADAALTPPANISTSSIGRVQMDEGNSVGMLIKKQTPVYPQDAKDAHATGKVVLQGVIGRDGTVHDLRVLDTPWPSLTASALWSVSQWRYRPYLLNGDPVEVETTINVIYSMSY